MTSLKNFHRLAVVGWFRLLVAATGFAALTETATAASGTWTNLNNGSWATATNWNGGVISSGAGSTADFSTLTLGGPVTVTLDGALTNGNFIFGDIGNAFGWTLNTGAGGPLTLGAPTPTITVNNQTAAVNLVLAGTNSLTKSGAGTLSLGGANTYNGGTTVSAGTLVIGNTVLAGDTTSGSTRTNTINVAAGAFVQSTATLSLNASSTLNPAIGINGAGTLQLVGTTNSATFPDLNMNANDTLGSTANWGVRVGTTLDLGSLQRFIWGMTDHAGVGEYGVLEADCQFGGSIIGAGGLTLIAQDNYSKANPMETPFCLNASNSFAGPVEIRRGAVYLGNTYALTQTNVLFFNSSGTNNARLFLYGNSIAVSNLSSTVPGNLTNNMIADANNTPDSIGPATLTIFQGANGTYTGRILDFFLEYGTTSGSLLPTLSLVKNGPANLVLAGTNGYTGTTTIGQGTLILSNSLTQTLSGAIGGSGALILSGTGSNILSGANTLTGGMTLNAGALAITSGSGLGTGTYTDLETGAGSNYFLTVATAGAITVSNNIVLPNNGGTNILTKNASGQLSLNGTITGGGPNFVLRATTDTTSDKTTVLAFNGTNTFAGEVQLWRGVVLVGNASALGTATIACDANNSPNGDLEFGSSMIFTNPLTLLGPTSLSPLTNVVTLTGAITGNQALSIDGTGSLIMAGPSSFSGALSVNSGTFYLNTAAAGGGAVTVGNGATLGGNGSVAGAVTVANGGVISAGDITGSGALTLNALTLGNTSGNAAVVNVTHNPNPGILTVANNNGLTLNGGANSVTINIGGAALGVGQYPLISYQGSLGGAGFAAFKLGTLPNLPANGVAELVNNTANSSIDVQVLAITAANTDQWSGALGSEWSTNMLAQPKNWVSALDGVTSKDFTNVDIAIFNDAAKSFTADISVADVTPANVVFSNAVNPFLLTGSHGIAGTTSLNVNGTGGLTVANNNSYSGQTVIAAGTLQVGNGGTGGSLGSGVISNFSRLAYDLSGAAALPNLVSGPGGLQQEGSGTLILSANNNYSGGTIISAGTLQVDNGGATGSLGAGPVTNNGALTFSRSDSPIITNVISGSGSVSNNSGALTLAATNTYAGGTTLNGGSLAISNGNALGAGPLAVAVPTGGLVNFLTVANTNAVALNNNISLASVKGTNVLTKASGGMLTLAGTITGGANAVLRTTTTATGDGSTMFQFANPNAFAGGLQISGGVVAVGVPTAIGTGSVFLAANNSTNGDLNFTAPMIFTNPVVLQSAGSVSPGANSVTLAGPLSGTKTLTKYGAGTLILAGTDTRSASGTTVNAGTLRFLNTVNTYANQVITVATNSFAQTAGLLNLNVNQNGSVGSVNVTGAGTLQLISTNNGPGSPDVYFGPDHSGNSFWGAAINTTLDLGNAQRFFYGNSGHNGVGEYGLTKADCVFNGPIIGSGGMTIIAQMTYTATSPPMEVPFCFNAANTFTGPVELQRGSIYLGHAGALSQTNVLFLNSSIGHAARFFLYGQNAIVANLSSSIGGSNLIVNGNEKTGASLTLPAVTLTDWQNVPGTFWGSIQDVQPEYDASGSGTTGSLNIAKYGLATLTLNGSNSFTGTLAINAGMVYVNSNSTGGGLVTVANGAALGGYGSISGPVIVTNGGVMEAGDGSATGTLSVNSLVLGASSSDAIVMNFDANPSGVGQVAVINTNGFTNNATVTVNVNGAMPSAMPVVYTLISYAGSIRGGGSIVLGTVPDLAVAYITNNTTASAIQLVVSSVTIPAVTWVGTPINNWDLLGANDWKQTGTSTLTSYADGDQAFLDDSASNFVVNLAGTLAPNGVLVSNSVNNYVVNGFGGISSYTGLTKEGTGTLTMNVSNSYSGPTVISAGTLSLGQTAALPGGATTGAGAVTVNGTLDLGGFSPTVNNLSGSGVVDNLSGNGSPVLTVAVTGASAFLGSMQNTSGNLSLVTTGSGTFSVGGSNLFSGGTTINSGTLQVGNGGTLGTLGSGSVNNNAILAFDRSDSFSFPNNIIGAGFVEQNGLGTTILDGNLTYTGPTLVNAGTLIFPNDVTFDVSTGTTLAVAAGAVMQSEFVLSLNGNSSATAIDISGAGTTRLASTIDAIESFPDLFVGANNTGVSTANYGIRIASGFDLGSVHRLVWALSSRDDVTTYGLAGSDCQFAGTVSGTAELSLLGKNSFSGVNTMEEQFAFTASNTWTGPLEVLRGSVYLGNSNALTSSNVLILDPAASVNSRLFLYGFNAAISDLQTGGYGDSVIADGNNITTTNVGPATLFVTENNPTTFAGNLADWYTEFTAPPIGSKTPVLSLVKNGAAALTLTGSNTYSGTTVINTGTLYMNGSSSGGGLVTVNAGGVLAGNGTMNSAVTVKNGGAIQTGDFTINGALTVKSVALGSVSGDLSVLNLASSAELAVAGSNGLTMNGGLNSVTINVGGTISTVGAVPLITYSGTFGGAGFTAFQLGSTPAGVVGVLSNDTVNSSIDFVATQVTIPRWTGALSSEWSTQTLAAPKNWVLNSDGVTQVDYVDGENVRFDDTASSTAVNINIANVSPLSVTFSNSARNYIVSGVEGITGTASLTLQGAGRVALATPDSYTGPTTIAAGTLSLAASNALPGGTGFGNLTVNGTLDVGGFSPTVNNLSGSGTVDNISAGGTPLLTVNTPGTATFGGVIENSSGSLGLTSIGAGTFTLTGKNTYAGLTTVTSGTLVVNGSLGKGGASTQNGAALGGTGAIAGTAAMADGSALNLTANSPLTVGSLALNGAVTVYVSGSVSSSNTATYVLLNHGVRSGLGQLLLAPVPGIINSGFTATLKDTTNQLQLVVAPTQPTGTIADVRHVVIFMQENRSFDHYFGTLHGVHGFSDHVMLTFTNGNTDLYQPSGSGFELPFHTTTPCLADLAHDWTSTHGAWNSGKWNQWISEKGTETMAYYNRNDIPFYYSLADAFTICDEYHCSTMTSTDPNRLHLWTGMIDPTDTGGGPVIDNSEPANGWGTNWVTYPQFLQKAGVSWKVYQASDNYDDNALYWFAAFKNAAPGSPLYNNGVSFVPSVVSGSSFQADYTNLITQFRADVSNNVLPSVTWIVGPDVGSEHPSWSPGDGEILTKGLLDALASNPSVYNSTVFILNYDENDGFFDHAVPITPTNGTPNEFVGGLPIGLGVRVPCIVVSPWSAGGFVCSQVFDHTSIIRFLEQWTGVQCPNISAWRRQVCGDLTSAFDFAHPNTNYPTLLAAVQNDCPNGTTVSPPSQQILPTQESGTLLERPLPYQPNVLPVLNCGAGSFGVLLTNSGASSVHFSIYPNAYRSDGPWPFDVNSSNAASTSFNISTNGNNYNFSCYGPNGFLRQFAGNLTADCGQIEAISYINPYTDGFELALANPSASAVTFHVTNGYYSNSLASYVVPAGSTNIILFDTTTNGGWYDLTTSADLDGLFVRRCAGHIESNAAPSGLISSENPSGYHDNVAFTANFVGYSTPTGMVQFKTNGVAAGAPVALANGFATVSTALLPRLPDNMITAEYSGDLLNPPATNSLAQIVLDHPPVAGNAAYTHATGISVRIAVSDLLTNVTDTDGDTITLVGVGTDGLNLLTTNGATLATNGAFILYTNSVTPNVNDSFEYTVTDGFGATSVGTVQIVLSNNLIGTSPPQLIISSTTATANFFGVPGYRYSVDRSTNLTLNIGLGWVPISTNVAPASGIIQVKDTFKDLNITIPPLPPSVFYRVRYNP